MKIAYTALRYLQRKHFLHTPVKAGRYQTRFLQPHKREVSLVVPCPPTAGDAGYTQSWVAIVK